MRKTLLLTAGGAVGFVLGARAGRPTYDRMVRQWSDLASSAGLSRFATTMKDAGADVRDSALDRASEAVSDATDTMTDRIGSDRGPRGDHHSHTEATPTGADSDLA